MVEHINGTNGFKPSAMDVVTNLVGADAREIRHELKDRLSEMLSKGEISKQEMKDVLKYADKNLMKALAAKNHVEYAKEESKFIDKKTEKLLNETGLTVDDLFQAGKLTDSDFTINTVKLTKEEKALVENGLPTRSELANIQNVLNAKIKAQGGDRLLTERETLRLMKGIGYADGTSKVSTVKGFLAGIFPPFNIANAITSWSSSGEKNLVSTIREEKPYGSQAGAGDSVINETEMKMKNLFSYGAQVQEMPVEEPLELPPME